MGKKSWLKGLVVTLIATLVLEMAPAAALAEAAKDASSAIGASWQAIKSSLQQDAQPEFWTDEADRTETPQFYSFTGDQILEERSDLGEDRLGGGGTYLRMKDSAALFPSTTGAMILSWTDTLEAWMKSQNGEPVNPPSGYTVSVELKDIQSGNIYILASDREDNSGLNQFSWNGKDASGTLIPDGSYYWKLRTKPLEVTFEIPPLTAGGVPTKQTKRVPTYDQEYQRVLLDRTAPEIVGIHPLGNRLAVETRDFVAGMGKVTVQGAASATKSWTTGPLRTALSVQTDGTGELLITVEDLAGNKREEKLPVDPLMPGTGAEDFVPNAEALVADQNVRVNLTTGNGTQEFAGFTQAGPGVDLSIFFTYNHQNRLKGSLGYGWTFNLDSRLTKWEDGNITWQGFDGTLYWFKPDGDEYVTYADGQKQHYPQLTMHPNAVDPLDRNAFIMEWSDQLRYRFKNDGRFWMIMDRDQNEIYFDWTAVTTPYGRDSRIGSVTDTNGHDVRFQYAPGTGTLNSTIVTELDGLGHSSGSSRKKFYFVYNTDGEFEGYRAPLDKFTRFIYDDLHRITKVIDNDLHDESKVAPDSVETDWIYDQQNRVTRIGMTRKQDQQEEFLGVQYGDKAATVASPLGDYTLRWNSAFRPTERAETVQTSYGTEQALTKYAYSANNLIRETDPMGRSQRFRYNDHDRIEAEQSPSGRIVHYTYDDQMDLLSETGPLGYDISYQYVKNGRKIIAKTTTETAVDPAGVNAEQAIVTKEEFSDKGLLVKSTDAVGQVFDYTYDENGFLTSDGTRDSYAYDSLGYPTKVITDAGTSDAAETRSTFNLVGWLLHREGPTGLVEDYQYDMWGRVTKATQQDQNDAAKTLIQTYRYDDGGHLIVQADGLTQTTYTVDGVGQVLAEVTVPLESGTEGKREETFTYNSSGWVVKQVDSRGEISELAYNKAGQQVKIVVSPENATTSIEYDEAGRQKAVVAADGGRTEYEYDLWDRVIRQNQSIQPVFPRSFSVSAGSLSGQLAVTNHRYDSAGRLIEDKEPNGAWTRYVYDGNGNVSETLIGGPRPQWNGTFLGVGTPDSLNAGDEVLSREQTAYDKLGRLLSVTDGNGNKTEYHYTGELTETRTSALTANGETVVYTRSETVNPDGQLIRMVSESGDVSTAVFDAFGHEVEAVNEEGQKTTTKVDAYGRLSERIEMVDRSGATQKFYYGTDAWGNVREEKWQLNDSEWATTTYRYLPEGELNETTSPSGLVTVYAYDAHGQLKQVTERNQTGATLSDRVTRYEYDAMGRQIKVVQPDGSEQVSVYDTAGNVLLSLDGLSISPSSVTICPVK